MEINICMSIYSANLRRAAVFLLYVKSKPVLDRNTLALIFIN